MATVDSALTSKCMDFCHALASQNKSFTFLLTMGPTFTFSLDTKVSLPPAAKSLKRKSPSVMRRNAKRREEYLKKISEPLSSSTGNQVAADFIDVTLATKDDLQASAHKIVLNATGHVEADPMPLPSSILSPPTTEPPASSTSTPLPSAATSTSNSSPSSPSDWKVVSSKQHSRAPPVPSPDKLSFDHITYFDRRMGHQVFKCKKKDSDEFVNACNFPWTDLQCLKTHDRRYHGGPRPH